LIAWSTLVDYAAVRGMSRSRRRKAWLALSVVNNLGMLGFFKYGAFAAESLTAALARVGVPLAVPPPGVLLPVGISFYVFKSLTYTIDFYRGQVSEEPSLVRYAAYVSLFPQLLAGPIDRARNLLPQLAQVPRITAADAADGASLFIVGLFKKAALADSLALYVEKVYAAPGAHEAPALALATIAFSWQIYFDFSGYTDMARGIGRAMGIRLMENFDHPYLATGLGDFWHRWHKSLSTWFLDYVYIPLGGNRRGPVRTYVNMALTMLISGLWHGAAWTFVAWGAMHALGRVLTRRLETTGFYERRVPAILKRSWVFAFVTLAWVFFRAGSIGDAWTILARMAALRWADPACPLLLAGLVAAVWLYQRVLESRFRPASRPHLRVLESRLLGVAEWAPVRVALVAGMALYLAVAVTGNGQPFIYFQF